jgi:hypothetical protein
LKSRMIFLCAAILLGSGEARAQQQGQSKDNGREQAQGGAAVPRGTPPTTREAGDLTADNLDRVAATARQILEILERDAGLMVEFQRTIAQDASANGQLLEESDLTVSALTERLSVDLRTRVLATRLLQRYGYLLPKVNPDSVAGQEQKLVLEERAQLLARARERNNLGRESAPGEETAGCDFEEQSDCNAQGRAAERARTYFDPGKRENFSTDPNPPREDYPTQPTRPDAWNSQRVLRTEATGQGTAEPTLVSSPQTESNGNISSPGRGAGGSAREGAISQGVSGNEDAWNGNATEERGRNSGTVRGSVNDFERRYSGGGGAEKSPVAFEPVRMVHRPNPYADVPSLYDLYVQASWPTQEGGRFGADVFRHGAVNADILPMDLPVGPEYVLGPGDSLSIDLWGGVSQRLFRVVDREGRLLLP